MTNQAHLGKFPFVKIKLEEVLNKEQAKAAAEMNGPLLIIAGAGSGKTRMITYRIAHMLEEGIDEKNILALTFTNKAAKEMSERIRGLVKKPLKNLTTTTFHSFGLGLLKQYIQHLGYHNNFSLYDANDNQALIKNSIISLGYEIPDWNVNTLATYFSDYKTGRATLEEKDTAVRQIYNEWLLSQKAYNVVDFDDLILLPVKIFEKKPFVLSEVQERFKYILVDEFQDTSLLQYKFVSMIAEKYRNIAVVGDDDQSIYSWRGANYRNIEMFEHDFPERKEFKLEQNYRCSENILKAANAVIANNDKRKEKALWTESRGGAEIIMHEHENGEAEATFIASDIKRRIRNGECRYQDIGILVRTNMLITQLENVLVEENIPVRISGGKSFYDRREIRDMLCYLKVLVNPKDDVSLLRIINTPRRGIGRTTVEKIRRHADDNYQSLSEAIEEMILSNELTERTKKNLSYFMNRLKAWREHRNLSSLLDTIVNDIGYQAMLEEEYPENEKIVDYKMMGIRILSDRIRQYLDKNPHATLRDYINIVAIVGDENDDKDNKVNLMTMHAAKGLEFGIVHLAGIEDNIIPSSRALEEDPKNIEEERRLFYVAITRAKKVLLINSSRARENTMHEMKAALPSRFLEEIPTELFRDKEEMQKEVKDDAMARLRKMSGKATASASSAPEQKKPAEEPKAEGRNPLPAAASSSAESAIARLRRCTGSASSAKKEPVHDTLGVPGFKTQPKATVVKKPKEGAEDPMARLRRIAAGKK